MQHGLQDLGAQFLSFSLECSGQLQYVGEYEMIVGPKPHSSSVVHSLQEG